MRTPNETPGKYLIIVEPKEHHTLKYVHIEKVFLFLVTTCIYLNKIHHVTHHSIAIAHAILPAPSK